MTAEQFQGITITQSNIVITEDTIEPLILAHGGKISIQILADVECELIQLVPADISIQIGCQARLTHYMTQGGNIDITQKQDSFYTAFIANTREDFSQSINICLQESGSEAEIFGLLTANNTQKVNQSIKVDHASSYTRSNQYVKSIADGNSEVTMNARIVVEKEVKQIQATQLNKNILLSDQAIIHAEPWLEIDSDDVQVAHGSATGQIDPEQLAYLTSRGISEDEAQTMLKQAFVMELTELIPNEAFKSFVLSTSV